MKVLFCQISDNLINNSNKESLASKYYSSIYELHSEDGYVKPEHFWEIPLWIAELSYVIKDKELHIVEDIKTSINYINNLDVDMVLFSVLAVNKDIINSIVQEINKRVCVSGYTRISSNKAHYFSTVKDFCSYFGIVYKKGTDYSLFKGYSTIPRLQLSTGCFHKCTFCTIPKAIVENETQVICQQVNSFEVLNFKLIYIDDKTFGQARNYKLLEYIYLLVKNYNKEFKGFVIQTTAIQVTKIDFTKLHIFAVEIGMESFNDEILKSINKPANTKHITKAIEILKENNLKVILNAIIGLPGETKESYGNTLNFIEKVQPYALNIYNLALYEETRLSAELEIIDIKPDENMVEKSYNSKEQNQLNKWFEESIFNLGLKQLKQVNE